AKPQRNRKGSIPVPAARPVTDERRIAFALVLLGALLLLREAGLWAGDLLMFPLMLGAVGSGVIWATADETDRSRWTRLGLVAGPRWRRGPAAVARTAGGALLVVLGMALFLATNGIFAALRVAGLATGVTLLGALLVLGPYLARLAQDLREERVARIRSQERADVAAHLHDSVLHTLALIQRASATMSAGALARVQERELRAWLYGREQQGPGRLRGAVDELAGRVERLHGVPVDAVVVGDAAMDEPLRALVAAAQEAAVNAARHSGAARVSLYVEAEADGVTAWVRDEGRGFDPAAVPADRRGIADAVVGRVQRHGGTAVVASEPGEGTEVHLWMPGATTA
ncbi:MAG TPA: ATP-binding protein, partial [Egibacteraceae bacterium]|nr:ATP-binding protein [Egibacteraceae bacterium]